jgi:two-component system sensor histidine kinase YesM
VRRKLGFGTLESRIYLVITLMLFTSIVIMQLVFFQFVTTTITTSTLDNNTTLLNQLVTQIDSYISGIESLSGFIVEDEEIQAFFENPDNLESRQIIERQLNNYKQSRVDISNILLYAHDGTIVLSDQSGEVNLWSPIKEYEWYENALKEKGKIAVSESYVQNIIIGQYSWVVSLSREIFSKKNGKSLGVLLVDLKFNRIDELCRSLVLGKNGYDFIIDNRGNYIYHPTQQLINSNLRSEPISTLLNMMKDDEKKHIYINDKYFMSERSKLTGWNVISVTHKNDIITDWQNIQIIYTLVGLILFLIVGPVTKRISSGITKPVRKLQKIMKTVENGEFNKIGPIKATEEIRTLAYDYDIMVGRIRELVETNNKDQELKRKSDLIALQAQINPHFLYNTLDSIIWMGEMGQNKEVVKMTSALSKLFRISISKGHEIITIRDEIAHVQSYLTIQGMRYQDKFSYLIDIEPNLHFYPILKITLQPLVENAIYHGIKENDKKGFIKITSRLENDRIYIDVEDNGKGMTPDELELLMKSVDEETEHGELPEESKPGMGLRNVHQRIRLYFGYEYGLNFKSRVGEGTTISVSIPAEKMEKQV